MRGRDAIATDAVQLGKLAWSLREVGSLNWRHAQRRLVRFMMSLVDFHIFA